MSEPKPIASETRGGSCAPAPGSASRLWRVTVQYTLLVVADNERKAETAAGYLAGEDGSEPDMNIAYQVRTVEDVPKEWRNSIPFGGDIKDNRTCRERVTRERQSGATPGPNASMKTEAKTGVGSHDLLVDPTRLPEQVSNDGREIWDWAGKVAEHIHLQAKMSELRTQLSRVGTVCGDCCKWMHSNSCPRETNVNGRIRGPSMNAPICNQYVEQQSSSEWRKELQKRLDALKSHNP